MLTFNHKENEKLFANVNKNLSDFEHDHLHHLLLNKSQNDLKSMFGDVRFVCMGGTSTRMHKFAKYMKDLLRYAGDDEETIQDITKDGDRYSVYKVGPILFANHGIGCPSISVLLTEVMKLLFHAECEDVTFFRIGTCGGIGVKPGTVIITEEALDGLLRPEYRQYVLGKEIVRNTAGNKEIIADLLKISSKCETHFDVISGKTLCAFDFYEAQARLDGIFCDYTETEKQEFLKNCKDINIVNIEMESLCFSGILNYANCKFAIVCVSLLDRMESDQVNISHNALLEFQERPFEIVGEYIKKKIESN